MTNTAMTNTEIERLTEQAKLKARECGLPDYMIGSLAAYVTTGRPVGDFLTAVLTNDLKKACAHADGTNQPLLYKYIYFLYNYASIGCWGSIENVERWTTHKGLWFLHEDLVEPTVDELFNDDALLNESGDK